MSKARRDLVKRKFQEYYTEGLGRIRPPTSMKRREFGFILFEEDIMVRHKGFRSERAFGGYLASLAPSDVFYSSAYYEYPEEPMEKKGWLGADLIFDIDSDHINTPCKDQHDYWLCGSCENTGINDPPKSCPQCGGSKFKKETWLCETCLEAAKMEALKLMDFLVDDFGFPSEEIEICFSGQRGYHAHVFGSDVRQLDQAARKEIVDYISGTGLKIDAYWRESGRELIGPDLNDPGWYGRIARGVYGLLSSSTREELEQLSGIRKKARTIESKRDFILEKWDRTTNWRTLKGLTVKTWRQIVQHVIDDHRVASLVDTVVTTDTHRLIRLPRSLHGKTGLMTVTVPADSLERFDPLNESIAFKKGTLEVFINEAHRFRLGTGEFGPYDHETRALPTAAALYLLCKRAAVPKDQ